MDANKPTTFWVSRGKSADHKAWLCITTAPPIWHEAHGWRWSNDHHLGTVRLGTHQALGLPSEPEPGRCWEVKWFPRPVELYEPSRGIIKEVLMVPIARDVTDELKDESVGR